MPSYKIYAVKNMYYSNDSNIRFIDITGITEKNGEEKIHIFSALMLKVTD